MTPEEDRPYKNTVAVLATMHAKERVIGPILRDELGLIVGLAMGVNTDQFGTFSREVERTGSQLDAARAKIAAGFEYAPLARVDNALAVSGRTGQMSHAAELRRIRGEILLKQTPADPAPAEAAFLTAIAIAQSQKARSFELRAALALAKLYISTNRAIEAHVVLGPVLEGFSPTPEFPEIAEAMCVLASIQPSV